MSTTSRTGIRKPIRIIDWSPAPKLLCKTSNSIELTIERALHRIKLKSSCSRAALVHRDPLVGGEETPKGWGGARRLWGKFAEL